MYIRVTTCLVRHLCAVASQRVQLQLEEGSLLGQLDCSVLNVSLVSYDAIALYHLPAYLKLCAVVESNAFRREEWTWLLPLCLSRRLLPSFGSA